MKQCLVLFAALFAMPAEAATLLDYNVYSAGHARIAGGSYGTVASTTFKNENGAGGTNLTANVAAQAALTAEASRRATELGALAATGALTQATQWNPEQGVLTGTVSGINVFTIAGDRWRQLNTIVLAGIGDGAIINIVGGGTFSNYVNVAANWRGDALNKFAADRVILNFVDATSVTLGGWNVNGTVLAAKADVGIFGGSIAGSVIARNFNSEGTTIGGRGFVGFAPVAGGVPEPATWTMLILGFGAIAGALRARRGRAPQVARA